MLLMRKSIKILHSYKVYRPDTEGGIPFVIAALSRLSDSRISNSILVARIVGKGRRYVVDNVPVEALCSFGTVFSTPLAPAFPFTLFRRARAADVVVFHAPFPIADLVSGWMPDDVALIVYWHADIVGYSWLRALAMPAIERSLLRADRIVVSDRTIVESSPVLSRYADKCVVVPYGVDTDFWGELNPTERELVQEIKRINPRLIVSVGRLVSYKGLDVLLRAMKGLDAQLVVVGEGPLEDDLKRVASEIGVAERVVFAGRLSSSEIKAYLHAASVFAFPSITSAEAFGVVQLEAMAAGLPIVNTALPTAVPLIARHEIEALTVSPGDPKALMLALRRVLDDPELAERLSRGGRLRALSEFSTERFLSRIKSVYEDAMQFRSTYPTKTDH